MPSSVVKNKRDGKLIISDNASTPNTLELDKMEGGFSFQYARPSKEFKARGKHLNPPQVRLSEDGDATGSIQVAFTDTDGSLAILAAGGIPSTWVPFNGTTPEVPMWKLELQIEGTAHGDASDYKIDLAFAELSGFQLTEGDHDMWQINFASHARPVLSTL